MGFSVWVWWIAVLVEFVMWLFCVLSDSGKCLTMLASVSLGNVLRLPLWIADSSVVFMGKPSAVFVAHRMHR